MNIKESEEREMGKSEVKASKEKKELHIVVRIVCLLLACVLWFVVSALKGNNYEERFSVKLQVTGTDTLAGFEVQNVPDEIWVTVTGDHSKVQKVTSEDLTAILDTNKIKSAGRVSVPVIVTISPDVNGVTVVDPAGYFVNVTVAAVEPEPPTETVD